MPVFVEFHRNLTDIIRILLGAQSCKATHDMENEQFRMKIGETLSSIL